MCREKKVRQQLEQFVSPKTRQVATKMALRTDSCTPAATHTSHSEATSWGAIAAAAMQDDSECQNIHVTST